MTAAAAPVVIEGVFRVVATTDAPPPVRRSPNRQRLAARILFWNFAVVVAVVAGPLVF